MRNRIAVIIFSFIFVESALAMKPISCGQIFQTSKNQDQLAKTDSKQEFKQDSAVELGRTIFQDEMDFSKLSSQGLRQQLDLNFQVVQKQVLQLENASIEQVRYLFHRLAQSMANFQNTASLIHTNETWAQFSDGTELESFAHHKKIDMDQMTYGNPRLFSILTKSFQETKSLSKQTEMMWKKWSLQAKATGVDLDPASKAELISIENQIHQYAQIMKEKFNLAQSHLYRLPLTTEFHPGIPENILLRAKELGKKDSVYAFSLTPEGINQFHPVLKYALDPNVRKEFYDHYVHRVSGLYDVKIVMQTLANLRWKKAQLLGKSSFADLKLPQTMTGSSENLQNFIDRVKPGFLRLAEKEMEILRQEKYRQTSDPVLQPWDVQYYAALYQGRIQSFPAKDLAMYFPMDRTLRNILNLAEQIYQVRFVLDHQASVWNADVQAYRVFDLQQKRWMGTLYADLFERKGKSSGAFADELQAPGLYLDVNEKTVQRLGQVIISASVSKMQDASKTFLTLEQIVSILHELGHGIHSLSYQQNIPIFSSFTTSTDFVEFPSQVLENWAFHPEILRKWGRHFETGQPLSEEMIQDLRKQRQILAGIKSFARRGMMTEMDHQIHSIQIPIKDMRQFEKNVMKDWKSVPYLVDVAGQYSLFRYIFFQGYESGFHGYQCCEVLDYDAFEYMTKDQVIDPVKGLRLRNQLLSLGSLGNLSEAYLNFRGQEPDPKAILRKAGYVEVSKDISNKK